MFGLRQKLILGFGGLLLILLVVSGLGVAVLRQHRAALDKFLYENWRSVEYGQNMVDALERLNDAAKVAAAQNLAAPDGPPGRADLASARTAAEQGKARFDENLRLESQNVTLPGEGKLSADLNHLWAGEGGYRSAHARAMDPAAAPQARADAYADLLKLSPRLKSTAQAIVQLNLDNMKPIDGRVKAMADSASRLMVVLAAAGVALAGLFVAVVGRSILQPLRTLTRSAREIEQGNLDLVVQVRSRDELRQLAEAFNSMAAKLREYRRTNRAKLVRTQETTQNAINSLPDAVAIVSPDGRVEMANAAAQRLFGLRPDAMVSELHVHWLSDLYHRTARDLHAVEPRGYESAVQVLDEGGGERFFLPHAVPVLDDDRQLLGVTVVLADVTHLRRLDEMKSGMISVVSHELKTPLTSIRMGVHLLLEERVGPLTADQSDIVGAMREDSDRLNGIVENLLDMGRIESGRALLDLRPEPAGRLAAEAVGPLKAAFHDKGVELTVDVPDDVPPVLADRVRVGHVFSNLLTNALRYTPPGGRVVVGAGAGTGDAADAVRFFVTDTGPGIPAAFLDRVFERFFRVPGQPAGSGAGLGLAIVRDIVEAHGGRVGVQSREGEGSTFSFALRRADEGAGGDGAGGNGRADRQEQQGFQSEAGHEAGRVGTSVDRG